LISWPLLNHAAPAPDQKATTPPGPGSAELASLRAEIDRLKGMVPDQSHAMADVAFHFANCWFAGQKQNWPLAQFNLDETRSHLRWAVRIIPVRKDASGNPIRLEELLSGIEEGSLKRVGEAIQAKDNAKFTEAYQQMLESCYACHLAAGKPYLRLQIPDQPPLSLIHFAPQP
jgi:hypothetical protein